MKTKAYLKRTRHLVVLVVVSGICGCTEPATLSDPLLPDIYNDRGDLLFSTAMDKEGTEDWIMEGPGELSFEHGWMRMYSPNEEGHHVLWNPMDFPSSFVAEWSVQNLETDAGLAIVFFAAKGEAGEDIFDPVLPERDGTFSQYTNGRIKSYHISYYTNAAHLPDRGYANLRKNNTFTLLQSGENGIPSGSTSIHRITLAKRREHIMMYVDDRKVIDLIDTGIDGPALGGGKIGLRQMQWTNMQYRNFRVWALKSLHTRRRVRP
jgi:hypothetical protein